MKKYFVSVGDYGRWPEIGDLVHIIEEGGSWKAKINGSEYSIPIASSWPNGPLNNSPYVSPNDRGRVVKMENGGKYLEVEIIV